MRFVIAGSSGLIGKALASFLEQKGHTVIHLIRSLGGKGDHQSFWDPEKGVIDPVVLDGADGVINLAGENIAVRWTEKKKKKILESRLAATRTIRTGIEKTTVKPKVWINASATGFYGYQRVETVDEKSIVGSGFLAYVCRKWEEEVEKGKDLGVRTVIPRIGVVLSAEGGMLKKMLLPFKLGLGGVIGSGEQPISWIALDDLVEIFYSALIDASFSGAVNCVHPQVVSQREFAKTLAKVLHRPTFFPMPTMVVRFLFGEMGEEIVLHGVRVAPGVLQQKGFKYRYPDLKAALEGSFAQVDLAQSKIKR